MTIARSPRSSRRPLLAAGLAAMFGLSVCQPVMALAPAPQVATVQQGSVAEGWIKASEFTQADGIRGDIALSDKKDVSDPLTAGDGLQHDVPASEQIPALSATLAGVSAGEKATWSGQVDPAREVQLLAYNFESDRYEVNIIRSVAEREFDFADGAQKQLEATGIPHSVLAGNHDIRSGRDVGPDSLYNETFGPDRYEALDDTEGWKSRNADYHAWKAGDNQNSYTLFTAGGQEFIAVSLSYDVTQEEADWAARVLDQYSTRNAILLTHAYRKPSDQPDGRGGEFSHDGQIINDRVLERSPNVALVLSGHEHGVSVGVRKDVGEPGNNVTELLADYQFYRIPASETGLDKTSGYLPSWGLKFGASFFRLLQFDLDKGEVSIDTYSPYLDNFGATEYDTKDRYNGHEDDMRLPVQFHGRTTAFSTDSLGVAG